MRKYLSILSSLTVTAVAGTALAQPPAGDPAPTAPPPETTPPATPTPVTPPIAATPPVEPPAPAPEAKPADAPPPKKLSVGKEGVFQPGLLAQGWFILDHADATTSTFRLRRAELSVKGEIVPKQVGYAIMIDPAKVREFNTVTVSGPMGDVKVRQPVTAVSVLQDFFITYISKYADASIGQFKIPVSWEGYNSSSKIILPERALVSSAFGDKRDLGLRIAKTFPKWGYSFGLFNGAGLNNLDDNDQKDIALRLEVYPVKGLTIAGVTYDSLFQRELAASKDRWEGDVRYEHGPYLVQAEYIRARDGGVSARVTGQGAYLALGYTIEDKALGSGSLQPVVRVGFFDSDVDNDVPATGADEVVHYDVGVNYYLRGHEMKLQGSYQRQQFDDKTANNQVIVAAQVAY